MKILLATSRFRDFAGTEITVLELAEELRLNSADVTIASFEVGGFLQLEAERLGITVVALSEDAILEKIWDMVWVFHPVTYYMLFATLKIQGLMVIYSSWSHFEPLESPPVEIHPVDLFTTNSHENLLFFRNEYPALSARTVVFPNSIPKVYFEFKPLKEIKESPRVAIVSNHAPQEVTDAADFLRSKGFLIDLYGSAGEVKYITPSLLRKYNAIITIGKTVPYCLALQIPVFCYDHFGGPGWITPSNIELAAEYNFSGRCCRSQSTAQQIADSIILCHYPDLKARKKLRDYAHRNFDISKNVIINITRAHKNVLIRTPLEQINSAKLTIVNILTRHNNIYLHGRQHSLDIQRKMGETVESLVIDRDSQKAGMEQAQGALRQLAQERDEQIARFTNAVESLVIDRDSQKAGMEQAQGALRQLAQERDEQIARFTKSIDEQGQTISSLSNEKEGLNKELINLYNSKSWRIISSVRKFSCLISKIYSFLFGVLWRRRARLFQSYEEHKKALYCVEESVITTAPLSIIDFKNKYRILLVSYYCPTRAHAGGLRILDIYSLIRQQCPDSHIDLLTHNRPNIDWSIEGLKLIFDNVYLSKTDDLSPSVLKYMQGGSTPYYDLVDLQFHQSAYHMDAYRAISSKVIFTPMESQAKVLFLDFVAKLQSGNPLGFKRVTSLIKLAVEEIEFCRKADEVVCVSSTDAAFLRAVTGTKNVRGIDTGISQFEFSAALKPSFKPQSAKSKELKIIYIAYFGSETNVIALKWFLENVHPFIKEKVPGYVLSVVGRGDLSSFKKFLDSSVDLVGEVPEIAPYISEARVGIAPALGGSGFRGKVNQYAVLGVPCVVSPIGLKGLAYTDEKNVCVAETANDFADDCIRLLTNLEFNDRVATAARQLCLGRYSWQSKWPQIRKVYGMKEGS
jgi:glycosyltransferase involved in cell wall biosynthesis